MRLLAGSLVVMIGAVAPAAACPRSHPYTVMLTTSGTELVDGGGAVFETRYGFGGPSGPGIVSGQPTFRLRDGTSVEATAVAIAGTLYKLVPKTTRDVELVTGGASSHSIHMPRGRAPATAAPSFSVISVTRTAPAQHRYAAGPTTSIVLASAPPPGVLALVFFDGTEAVGWLRPGGTSYTLTSGGKQCASPHAGAFAPKVGDAISGAWLDRHGRLSSSSRPITVVLAP